MGVLSVGGRRVEFVLPDVDSALEADLAVPLLSETSGEVVRVPLADLRPVKPRPVGIPRRDGFEFIVKRAGRRTDGDGRVPSALGMLSAFLMRPFAGGSGNRAA